ncbi:MAG: hypothetical protein K8F91_01965, partial [Candidatus Obscuribacterales bacterium]|nr:hypothetical protein [Candidatus Obscuribacterales bacterium]
KKLDFNQKTTIDDLLAARKHLREAISQSGADMPVPGVPLLTATEMLDSSHGDFQKRIAALMDTRSKLNRVSFQQKLASGAIGGQLLAFGILGEAGWQKYGKNFRIRDFNKALFAGNITGVTATSMALGATGFAAVAGEVNEWKMRKAYTRPEDLLADHLVSLDTLEAQVLKIGD